MVALHTAVNEQVTGGAQVRSAQSSGLQGRTSGAPNRRIIKSGLNLCVPGSL